MALAILGEARFFRRHGRCGFGHPDPIVMTPQEYVQRAVNLAKDLARVRELRAGRRGRVTPSRLADGKRLVRSLQTVYRRMCERYRDRKHEQIGLNEVGEEHDVGHA